MDVYSGVGTIFPIETSLDLFGPVYIILNQIGGIGKTFIRITIPEHIFFSLRIHKMLENTTFFAYLEI